MKGVSKEKPVKKKTVKSKLREKMSAGWMTVPSGAEIVPPDHPMCRSIVELIGDDLPVVNDGAMVGRFVREEPKTYRVDLRVSDNVVFDIERNGRGAVEHFLKEEMIKRGFDFSAGARYPIQRDRDITTGRKSIMKNSRLKEIRRHWLRHLDGNQEKTGFFQRVFLTALKRIKKPAK